MERVGRIALIGVAAAGIGVATAHAVARVRLARTPARFSISGHVDGLLPGQREHLPLRIRNPWSWTIRVKSVTVQIGSSGRPCPVGNVEIHGFKGSFAVRPRSTRTLMLAARIRRGAPEACEGATFALTFRGTARRR
jgi:hypothetical protein